MERKERGWETNGESEDGGSEADDVDEGETSLHAREDGQKKKVSGLDEERGRTDEREGEERTRRRSVSQLSS